MPWSTGFKISNVGASGQGASELPALVMSLRRLISLFLASDSFLDEVKRSYTDLINIYVRDDKEKLKVFDKNGVYLPMKKVGKNNPKAE